MYLSAYTKFGNLWIRIVWQGLVNSSNFRSQRWGSSLSGLRMLDPPLDVSEKFPRMCLQSHLQTSPPSFQKSYLKFRNPRTNFEIFTHKKLKNLKMPPRGLGGSPNFFWG